MCAGIATILKINSKKNLLKNMHKNAVCHGDKIVYEFFTCLYFPCFLAV